MAPAFADVVIVGGGPVGSLIAYQLARFGCIPYLMEQDDKTTMPCYGRASTFWPRTIEMLDQLDLFDRLMQTGVVTRNSLHFRNGQRVHGGLLFGNRMDKLGDTFFKFSLHLRQRLTEERFVEALAENGVEQHMRQRIESFAIDETAADGYPITVHARDLVQDEVVEVKTQAVPLSVHNFLTSSILRKYLVGADGGKSTVRSLAKIPFMGERTTHRWVRMDARVQTNMPNPRCLNSIDSASHGQILWCPIDNGLTRIGYVFSQALLEKYGGVEGVTQDVAVEEAKAALAPFEVEFQHVEWFTIYGIGQAIAGSFWTNERIFLAGDACHTHSSGSAQGLNTGIHDAVNLAWKLALVIRGFTNKSLLDTYDLERRPSVQQVIDNDKVISLLISGHYPPQFEGRKEHPHYSLWAWGYPIVRINMINCDGDASAATISPGQRGPDVFLNTIGTNDPIRLHRVLKNDAKFSVVIFAGKSSSTQNSLASLQAALSSCMNPSWKRVVKFVTIAASSGNGVADVLGRGVWGRVFWDPDGRAHGIYGVDDERGAMLVFRPDGWIGCVLGLSGVKALEDYFGMFMA
ncbi:Pentachlorophenol 4-monooxygenase [Mycena chlorophos]|uniref:Pentachlorophenol 4-monooxygenase n=1 Tax=Mycena chlorophos TaxID=658473 RepID=A0A8H6TGW1_MYCCL|nr:Pentachlorophenol 4-monooxygenase [Mycena chlorophos]